MNALVCVNTEAENLLSRIPIRDSTFFDEFFRDFLGLFRKIDIFGNFRDFWKKGALGVPGSTFWERLRLKIGRNGVKMMIYGTNDVFYLNFQDFTPILGSPRG